MKKFVLLTIGPLAVLLLGMGIATHFDRGPFADQSTRDLYLRQLENDDDVPRQIQADYAHRNNEIASRLLMTGGGGILVGLLYVGMLRWRSTEKPSRSPEL